MNVIADRGDKVIFNVPKNKIRPGTDLAKEIAVLEKKVINGKINGQCKKNVTNGFYKITH